MPAITILTFDLKRKKNYCTNVANFIHSDYPERLMKLRLFRLLSEPKFFTNVIILRFYTKFCLVRE